MEIWKFLIEHDNGVTNFHFEISADLLTDEEIALIGQMRPGLSSAGDRRAVHERHHNHRDSPDDAAGPPEGGCEKHPGKKKTYTSIWI